ncbi:MAG TPA: DUF4340 domain-containing protein [Candidatus Acidoferrales bacterium]|nr:DUF4340 domain-containing protein [Candidatus Acidoferrales bacterium]
MKKSTKILIGLLVLLGIAYAIQRLTFSTSTTENSNPFSNIDTSKVNQISILSDGREIVIVRESRGWFLTNPLHFPANLTEVNLLLDAVAANPSASVVADNLTDSVAYGLGAGAPTIKISENIQKEVSLRVGNITPDFDGCYVEVNGNKKILDLSKNIRTYAGEQVASWRDKRIFDFSLDEIQAADFALGDTLYHFFHRDTLWQVNGNNVPLAKIQDVVGNFVGTMAIDFVDTSLTEEKPLVDYGFSLSDGTRVAGKVTKSGDQTYASNSSLNQNYIIGSTISENLIRGLREIGRDYLHKETLKR